MERLASVPKKIAAPKMRWNAPMSRRYSALWHSERVEHLGGIWEGDAPRTLSSGQSREEERD
jgi:hypothetical protein